MNKLLRAVWSVAHNRRPFELRGQGRFFQGYYGHYCYMPLYVFCCDFLLLARLRTADVDPAKGAEVELARIVGQIRERWPSVHIIVRGDAGFAREALMAWCERNDVDYVFGLAKNRRLQAAIASQMEHARRKCLTRKKPARAFRSFFYRTRESWSRARRVIGKAEHTLGGANPRFIVTSLPPTRCSPALLYEGLYCERGDMENRIKEQQLELFADRTSTATLRANQLQLWLSSVAYLLLTHLRRVGLRGTELAAAQVGTIRNRLLEIGAVVAVSVRRVFIQLSSAFPLQATFVQILENLRSLRPRWE